MNMNSMKLMLFAGFLVSLNAGAAVSKKSVLQPKTESILEMLKLPANDRHQALAELPDSVYDSLWTVARDDRQSMNVRWRAVTSAALLRKENAVTDLVKCSKSSEWFMRNASLVSLSEFAPKQALPVARRLVKDPALVVRSAAVEVLAKQGGVPERELLWQEMQADYNTRGNESLWIRGQIAKALAEKPRDIEMKLFAGLLDEKDETIKKACVQGLERLTGMKIGEGSTLKRTAQLWQDYIRTRR